MRFSEKLLEMSGISVETMDLSELFGLAGRIKGDDATLKAKIDQIVGYVPSKGVPSESVTRTAKLGVVIDKWMADKQPAGQRHCNAGQRWRSFRGSPLYVNEHDEQQLVPSACETDIGGVVGMWRWSWTRAKPARL